MDNSRSLRSSRFSIALIVLSLHMGALLALMAVHRQAGPAPTTDAPLELLYLPPVKAPRMLSAVAPPKHLRVDVGISVAPPSFAGSSAAAPVAQSGGGGAGVNWAAEARRALVAYEIRRDQRVEHATLGLSPWDGWLPGWQRRSGERMRTPGGDWIVWINGSCYQIASWHPEEPATDAAQPPTICLDDAGSEARPAADEARGE